MTEGGKYFPVNAEKKRGLYINLTNRCNNDCPFCLREKKVMTAENSLWLENEPTADEVKKALDAAPLDIVTEIVFCGFGEPTIRLAELLELLKYVKKIRPQIPTRLNTNGLGNLEHGRNIESEFENILDTASISLNAATAERYLQITRSKFGLQAYAAMLDFAQNIKNYVPNVILTVVDKVTPPAEIEQCKKICEERGLKLRVRPYEDS
jgi:TatD family-associated radical SAM protein